MMSLYKSGNVKRFLTQQSHHLIPPLVIENDSWNLNLLFGNFFII